MRRHGRVTGARLWLTASSTVLRLARLLAVSTTRALACGLVWVMAVPVTQAAVPVEDMSTGGAEGPVTQPVPVIQTGNEALQGEGIPGATGGLSTPQPVLPEALSPQTGSVPQAGSGGYPGYSDPAPGDPTAGASLLQAPQLQPGQNAQLFYELQQLQSELAQLRGVVESQAFEIKRLQELQRSQYLDIDRRLAGGGDPASSGVNGSGVNGSGPRVQLPAIPPQTARVPVIQTGEPETALAQAGAGAVDSAEPESLTATESTVASNDVVSAQSTPATPVAAPKPELVPSEQEAYARAFELMKDQQFEQSIVAYQGVINEFPDGSYAPESRYWLGELYLMSDRLEDARGSFNQVVAQYPAHQKVPLSLYKLGVVNHRLGGTTEALTYLDDVVVRYPDTPAAGLARTYAAELR